MKATPTNLMRLLNALFQQQARDMASRVRPGSDVPDTRSWIDAMAQTIKPLMLEMWQQGMVQAAARMGAKVGEVPASVGVEMPRVQPPNIGGVRRVELGNAAVFGQVQLHLHQRRHVVCKAAQKPDVEFGFDLMNPRVLEAVDHSTYVLCRETMATATGDLQTALDRLRIEMRQGLSRGDANAVLAVRVRNIFADPVRAFRIAVTESSRAVHGGQMMAATEAGVTHHSWMASSDACEACLDLDGKTVKIGEPFIVLAGGGPYARVLHPPLHPHCFCTTEEEI